MIANNTLSFNFSSWMAILLNWLAPSLSYMISSLPSDLVIRNYRNTCHQRPVTIVLSPTTSCHRCSVTTNVLSPMLCHLQCHDTVVLSRPMSCHLCSVTCSVMTLLFCQLQCHNTVVLSRPMSCHLCSVTCSVMTLLFCHLQCHDTIVLSPGVSS